MPNVAKHQRLSRPKQPVISPHKPPKSAAGNQSISAMFERQYERNRAFTSPDAHSLDDVPQPSTTSSRSKLFSGINCANPSVPTAQLNDQNRKKSSHQNYGRLSLKGKQKSVVPVFDTKPPENLDVFNNNSSYDVIDLSTPTDAESPELTVAAELTVCSNVNGQAAKFTFEDVANNGGIICNSLLEEFSIGPGDPFNENTVSISNSQTWQTSLNASDLLKEASDLRAPAVSCTTDDDDTLSAFGSRIEEQSNDGVVDVRRTPYYLENFRYVLETVLSDEFYEELFYEEDRAAATLFRNLDENCQKLYVRLFLRKHRWMLAGRIVYDDICSNLTELLNSLVASDLVVDASGLDSVEEVVRCLPAPELKTLAKSLHINCASVKKQDLAEAVVKHAQCKNVSSFFAGSSGATEKMVLKRAKSLLGQCYRLEPVKRSVFCRATMLFGIHNTVADDDNSGSQQIFQMLMSRIGRVKYPEYTILRQTKIFPDRSALTRFTDALEVELELQYEIERKDYDAACEIYLQAKPLADITISDVEYRRCAERLPLHLRWYTAGAVYTRILTYGVEVLQLVKRYTEAVEQLRQLLGQNIYHVDYRGRWYDRLALNVDYHLKQPLQALEVIKTALQDPWVRAGRRLNLFQRCKKICQSTAVKRRKSSDGNLWSQFEADPMNAIAEPRAATIVGRLLPHAVPGSTPLYVSPESYINDGENVTVFTRVEDVALRHYADLGYTQGIHGEGSTVRTVFTLLMWDIIFMSGIADVFYTQFQMFPLDLYTDNFYKNRRKAIDQRLQLISDATTDTLCEMVGEAWDHYKDTLCLGVNWELFRDREHISGLVKCIGGVALSGIMRRLAELSRYVTGGFPDLTVWNPNNSTFKIVEVKGPGDRLSTKQILWLDYLTQLGIDAEVCYVKAVSTKKK